MENSVEKYSKKDGLLIKKSGNTWIHVKKFGL